MFGSKCVLFGIILMILDPISGHHGYGRHSYPEPGAGGLSGAGHRSGGLYGESHAYPSYSNNREYPSSSALSGGGYPGNNHGYPSSSGLSGNNRGYPPSTGLSGNGYASNNHGYPPSSGLSGAGGYSANKPEAHYTTNVYNNYHYTPPAQISYSPVHGGAPVSYPVYHGTPPTYVYQYQDSGSKYGTLLAGLALMNLGTLGAAAYAVHESNQNHGSTYTPQNGEVCKFAIKKDNGDYEETKIDCQIISGFILQDMQAQKSANNASTVTTTTVTNVTIVNTTNVGGEEIKTTEPAKILYTMLPNGTLIPVNATGVNIPAAEKQNETHPNATTSVVVTTTTTNTTLVSALDVKGKPVEVTPGMECFVIRDTPTSSMRKAVPCGLLQTYAQKSIQRSSAARNVPIFTIVAAILVYCI